MKKTWLCILLLLLLSALVCMTVAATEEDTMKILFIGNSATYTNDMPENYFAPLCEAAGYNVEVTRITSGGYYLRWHASANDTYGMQVTAALRDNKYDYVVFQELTTLAVTDPAQFYSSARIMAAKIRENGAEPILYNPIPALAEYSGYAENGWTSEFVAGTVSAAHNAIGNELGIKIAYAGPAVYDLMVAHPEMNFHHTDKAHPGKLGSFVIASTIFATMFGEDPTEVDFDGYTDHETAQILKAAAANRALHEFVVPDAYKTTSEGVGVPYTDYGIDNKETVVLDKAPTAPVISVEADGIAYPNGLAYSGIRGTKGAVASSEYSATALTDAQKADIADVGYGISVIGIEKMYKASSYDWTTSIANAIDGGWSGSRSVARMHFGDTRYDVQGNAAEDGKYQALITLNFGARNRFEAIGFFSNAIYRVPGVCEVFVSDDAKEWTRVPSASWNGITGVTLTDLGGTTPDLASGKAATSGAIFSMNNAEGQYIRIGIIRGTFEIRNIYSDDQMINPRELVVYGQRLPIGDVDLDGEATVEDVLLALHGILNGKENIRADVNCDGKNDLKDVLRILYHVVEKGE